MPPDPEGIQDGPRPGGSGRAPRRVLLLMSEVFADGGIQRFNRTLLMACARLGVPCDVLALNDSEESRRRWEAPRQIRVKVFGRNRFRFVLATLAALLSGRHETIIVGHVNLLTLAVSALPLRRLRHIRLLLIAHGIEVWTCIHGRRRRAIRTVDTVLCVSHYTARTIQKQAPELGDHRFSVFPNALSETWIGQFPVTAARARREGLPGRFALSVTRLDRNERYKGIVTALEAFAMLSDRSLHYLIAGRGDDSAFLQQVARRLGIADRVHFVGGVSDVELADLYRSCVAFVLPSGKEGFGIVFLEAMYFGAPVIAAAAKGAVDVVQHEHTGMLVPYGDAAALKVAMERLLSDSALRERIRREGRQTVHGEGRFTFNAYVRRLAGILDVPVQAGR
ncbi:MAG TPA: glycosyltransferase family 4 protein [Steroidobacteraceae bacterium]|nr:glycosyltransferase family 4 protein [Steroidobacteraceae bacterium]